MKKSIFLFLLVFNFCFSQTGIEIRLIDASIGSVDYSTFPLYIQSNDTNLNIILQNHNVNTYEPRGGHPIPSYNERIIRVACGTCNYSDLLNDLSAYNTVIESAQMISASGEFSDAAYSKLVDISIGIPTGTNSNNIITTNDNGLNQIFINHSVIYYQQTYPSSSNLESLKVYSLACNCNVQLLRNDLDNYNTVIESTEPMMGGLMLSTAKFINTNFKVYPNPFQDAITIETDLTIKNYIVFDLIGKKIIDTASNENLNSELSKLNSGTYLLKLQSEDNIELTKKIIKN